MDDILPQMQSTLEAIGTMAALTIGIIKPVVDAIKFAFPRLAPGLYPFLATLVGVIALLLLVIGSGGVLTPALAAQILLASIVGSLGAIGINRLHDKASEAQATAQQPAAAGEQARVSGAVAAGSKQGAGD